MTEIDLEKRVRPILNPNGPNQKVTEELVKLHSTTLKHPAADIAILTKENTLRNYVLESIKGLVLGYEQQSGKKYKGFLPNELKNRETW